MAVAYEAFTPEYWSERVQRVLRLILVSKNITNFEERSTLRNGDTVHRPSYTIGNTQDYSKNVGYSQNTNVTTLDETLVVDTAKVIPIFIAKQDVIQNKYSTANTIIDQATYKLRKDIDSAVFEQYFQAHDTFDDGDIAGTAGNGIAVTKTNVQKVISRMKSKLFLNNVETDRPWHWVTDPITVSVLEEYFPTIGFKQADSVIPMGFNNGLVAKKFNLTIYASNNLTFTANLAMGTVPTANDTVTIGSVVFTFVAAPAVAGDVDIGASAAISIDNLVAAINGGAGAGSAYIELSSANRDKMFGMSAADNATFLTLTAKGNSVVNVAETLTDVADIWSDQITHNIMGQNGSIDQVIQDEVNVETVKNPIDVETGNRRLGMEFIPNTLYGTDVFLEGSERMLDVWILNA